VDNSYAKQPPVESISFYLNLMLCVNCAKDPNYCRLRKSIISVT